MKKITSLLLSALLLSTAQGQDEPDKIGTVSMQQLLKEYYKTAELSEVFKADEAEVTAQDKTRVEAIKKLVEQTRALKTESENSSLSREKQEELFAKLVSQQREAQALENARVSWVKRKTAAFREKQAIEIGKLREEILEMVKEIGEERGFDFIFDRSGGSGTGVAILAYAKDATDLTPFLIERINRDAPEEGEEGEGEKKPTEEGSGGGE